MDGRIETYLLFGFVLSVIASVGGVIVVGVVLVRLPAGYFGDSPACPPLPGAHPLVRWIVVAVRNLLGAALVVFGLIMSVPGMPGPGILTILIGLMLLDFAQKKRWANAVISRPLILRATNRLRRKYGKSPFEFPSTVHR